LQIWRKREEARNGNSTGRILGCEGGPFYETRSMEEGKRKKDEEARGFEAKRNYDPTEEQKVEKWKLGARKILLAGNQSMENSWKKGRVWEKKKHRRAKIVGRKKRNRLKA